MLSPISDERADLRTGHATSQLINTLTGKGSPRLRPLDCMLQFNPPEPKPMEPAALEHNLSLFASTYTAQRAKMRSA